MEARRLRAKLAWMKMERDILEKERAYRHHTSDLREKLALDRQIQAHIGLLYDSHRKRIADSYAAHP